MRNILISLTSDQTIPNVLFIKEKPPFDKYIFISTEKMEAKKITNGILQACGINLSNTELYQIIKVIEDSLEDIEIKLKQLEFEDTDKITVNLTGGTKIMSIGVYNFFKEKGAEIFYLPLGRNIYQKIYPVVNVKEFALSYRISLQEYLTAYGINIVNKNNINSLTKDEKYTMQFAKFFLEQQFEQEILDCLRGERRKKQIIISEIPKLDAFLKDIYFVPKTNAILEKTEIEYLTGGWFEEYVYNVMKSRKDLTNENIGVNIQIQRQNTQNEFDVMFTYNNAIFVIECKTGLSDNKRDLTTDTLYKLTALKKDFGLQVHSFLFTTDNKLRNKDDKIEDKWQKRADVLGITIVDKKILSDKQELEEVLKKIFNE